MEKSKKIKIGISVIIGLIGLVFLILMCVQITKVNLTDISVKQEIKVTSRVDNAIAQTYKSSFTGEIKNNTKRDFSDITIHIEVKTKALGHKGSYDIKLDSLKAGGVYSINQIFDTNENFEKVENVYYKIGNGQRCKIVNGGVGINFLALLYFVPVIACIAIDVKLIKNLLAKPKQVIQPQAKKSSEEMLGEIISSQQELEKERLALEKVRLRQEEKKAELSKPVYCPYCGAKNKAEDIKCSSCNGNLK